MIDCLHGYEDAHESECNLIPSENQFYGFSRGKNLLEKYVQWIFVPAVKDATVEQLEARKTALGLLLERTVRARISFAQPSSEIREKAIAEYQKMLADRESELSSLSESLTIKFQDWAHPEAMIQLKWRTDADGAVKLNDPLAEVLTGEGSFVGQLTRFGHGLQRSFLITLLQELAGVSDATTPTLVLACEEPELFQHPPQIRHLASVFQRLTNTGAQVLVCTHSPLFVRGEGFEDIRLVSRNATTSEATVNAVRFADLSKAIAAAKGEKPVTPTKSAMKVAQGLQPSLNEMFFTAVLILVEGIEDAAYINSHLALSDQWDEFRRLGCHVVAVGGKCCMIQPLAIAGLLHIPTFAIFDGDADKCAKADAKAQNEGQNDTLMALAGFPEQKPGIPTVTLWNECVTVWHEDFRRSLINDIGLEKWTELHSTVQKQLKLHDISDLHKNLAFIGELLATAWDMGVEFPSLERVCKAILDFARAQRTPKQVIAAAVPIPEDQNETNAWQSSSIASVGYDEETNMLEVGFHSGRVYEYRNVPAHIAAELITAPSVGRYLNQHIKAFYICVEL